MAVKEADINFAVAAPAPLVKKVRAAARLTGERRTVTAMFLDIVSSTELAERVGSSAWKKIIDDMRDLSYSVIYRYEGTIARLHADELLAFFGAPVAHEDDPVRAVHTALELLETCRQYAKEVREKFALDFGVRISLSTGPVIIGPISSDLKYEYSALGGAVNAAARIESTKQAMTVLISEDTFRFVAPFFDIIELGEFDYEDQSKGVKIYQVQGVKVEPEKDIKLARFQSPLVGRESELADLSQLYRTVQAGIGRVVQVVGEPGLGKSRLIAEWKQIITEASAPPTIKWIEAQNNSYNQGQAYHLLIDLLHSIIGIPSSADELNTRTALQNLVDDLFASNEDSTPSDADLEIYPYLGRLLSLKLEGQALDRVSMLDPEGLRAQYLAAMRRLLQKLAKNGPLVVVLDNLQWADPSSIEVLTNIVPLASTIPILICLVTRPNRNAPGWKMITAARDAMGGRFSEIVLKPLSETDSWQIVSNSLKSDILPKELRVPILSRAEGNPFFIQEVLHMLIDRGAILHEDGGWVVGNEIEATYIPDNLRGLLLARIDSLAESVKRTLRVASVIGRQFTTRVLEKVLGHIETGIELINDLGALESAGLTRLAQVTPELTYIFQSALVQEVAYNSLLAEDRMRLHQAVGEALENLYPDQLTTMDLAARLGQHFFEAGDTARAYKYYSLAGEAALESYANSEAESRYRKALALARSDSERIPLLLGLGRALKGQSRNEDSIQVWRQGIEMLWTMGAGHMEDMAHFYALSARAAWESGNTPESLLLCQEGLEAVAEAPDSPGLAVLVHEAARAYLFNGYANMARQLCQQALEMAEKLDIADVQANALATMGLLPDLDTESALDALSRSVEIAESAESLSQAARAHTNMAALLANRINDFQAARKHYRRSAEIRRLKGSKAGELLSLGGVAETSLMLGDLDAAEATFPILQELLEEVIDPGPAVFHFRKIEAFLLRYRGDFEAAAQRLRDLQLEERQRGNLQNLIEVNSHLAEILLESYTLQPATQLPSWDEAEESLNEARVISIGGIGEVEWLLCLLSMVRTHQGRLEDAQSLLDEARQVGSLKSTPINIAWLSYAQAILEFAKGEIPRAQAAFESALAKFTELHMRWWRARVIQDLAEMYTASNMTVDFEQVIALLREALEDFDAMGASFYKELVKEKLRTLETKNYAQVRAHQKVAQEMAWAGKIQGDFLPKELPQIPGWQVAAALEPVRETSGDFYDFIPLPDGRWGIVIADVTDKGVGAALYMTLSHTLIRSYARENPSQPERVLTSVNRRMLADTPANLFVTAVYGILDPVAGTFVYANAGHNPPYILPSQAENQVRALTRTGMPLGIFEDKRWERGSVHLAVGDLLILYTDGIVEAQNPQEAFYGTEGLLACVRSNLGASAKQIQDAIIADVREFYAGAPQGDDLTLVILVRTQESSELSG